MARRRVKKTVKEAASSPPESTVNGNRPQIQNKVTQVPLIDQEGCSSYHASLFSPSYFVFVHNWSLFAVRVELLGSKFCPFTVTLHSISVVEFSWSIYSIFLVKSKMIATAECLLFFVFFLILFLSPKIVERQSAAIRAMRDVEIEHSLTGLRLLRSYFNEEQLQTPVLQFFKENLPNLSIIKNGENFEVQWNEKDDNLSMSQAPGGRDFHASLLHRLSIAYSDCSVIPSLHGFELSSDAGDGALFCLFFCVNLSVASGFLSWCYFYLTWII